MSRRNGSGALVVRATLDGIPQWEGKWRDEGTQVLRRLGPAWLVRDDGTYSGTRRRTRFTGWLRRTGERQDGWLTEEDAWIALRKAQAMYTMQKERRAQIAATIRFCDVAASWLDERQAVAGWKQTTRRNYTAMLRDEDDAPARRGRKPRARIMRKFGQRKVDEITMADIRAFLRELDRDDTIGPRSVNAHRAVLSQIMAFAVEQGWRADNPVEGTHKRREADERELIVYSTEQLQAIARESADEQDAAIIVTAAMTGLRLGELLELRWRDVHFAEQTIHVQRSYSAGLGVTSPKGRRGRSVPMADQVAVALARLGQRKRHIRQGDLVFVAANGRHLDPTAVRRRYVAARDRARKADPEIPMLRLHDLRHTYGSIAARSGLDVVWIKATMGHANVKTTMRYLHHRPAAADAARLTAAFAGEEIVADEPEPADGYRQTRAASRPRRRP